MAFEANNCKDFIIHNKQKFGITENTLKSEYLDICTHNVRYIASRRINERITLPSMSQFINSCTGLIDTAGGIDTKFASLRITHAKEQLVNCDTPNPGVQVTIKGQVIVRTKPANCHCPPSYMAIPVELVSEVIYDYYSTENGEKVNCLANVLPMVDGSCMVINLNCRIYREVCQGCSRYVAHIKGSVVDKLWKNENIWVEGIRPYTAPSITVCDVFEKDICDGCGDYIRMETQPMVDEAEYQYPNEGCGCGGNCGNNGCGGNCGCGANEYPNNCGNGCGTGGCGAAYQPAGCGCDDHKPKGCGHNGPKGCCD